METLSRKHKSTYEQERLSLRRMVSGMDVPHSVRSSTPPCIFVVRHERGQDFAQLTTAIAELGTCQALGDRLAQTTSNVCLRCCLEGGFTLHGEGSRSIPDSIVLS
jgi:hypothetical protein